MEGVRLLGRVELGEGARGDERVGELGPLLVGAGAPVDAVRAWSARRPRRRSRGCPGGSSGRSRRRVVGRVWVSAVMCVLSLSYVAVATVPAGPRTGHRSVFRRGEREVVAIGRRRCRPTVAADVTGVRSPDILDRSRVSGPGHTPLASPPERRAGERRRGRRGHGFGAVRRVGYPRPVLVGASTRRGHAPVAQRIEHLTTDQKVGGSNPYGRARRPGSGAGADCPRGCCRCARPLRLDGRGIHGHDVPAVVEVRAQHGSGARTCRPDPAPEPTKRPCRRTSPGRRGRARCVRIGRRLMVPPGVGAWVLSSANLPVRPPERIRHLP